MSESPAVLVAGHGPFPSALIESARMIGGALSGVHGIGLEPGETPTDFADRMREAIARASPAIVLTDLFGGTPHNVARLVLREHPDIALVSSVSLPLLLEVALTDERLERDTLEAMCEATSARIVSPTA